EVQQDAGLPVRQAGPGAPARLGGCGEGPRVCESVTAGRLALPRTRSPSAPGPAVRARSPPATGCASEVACSLARDHGARLILLHVIRPSVSALDSLRPGPVLSGEAREALGKSFPWPKPPDPSLRVEHRVAEWDAAGEILRLAQQERCDLIVMGTHGRTGL